MSKWKRNALQMMCLCMSIGVVGCGSKDTAEEVESQSVEQVVEETGLAEEIEAEQDIFGIIIPEGIPVVGDYRMMSAEQANAFAEVIASLDESYKSAGFVNIDSDKMALVLMKTVAGFRAGDEVEVEVPELLHWNGTTAEILQSPVKGAYMTDILEEDGEISVVYQKEMRFVTDVPEGYSSAVYGFTDGERNAMPTTYDVTFTNGNFLVTNFGGYSGTMPPEEYIGWIADIDLVQEMVSLEEFESVVATTNTEQAAKTYSLKSDGTIVPAEMKTDIRFSLKSSYDNSVMDTVSSYDHNWLSMDLMYRILTKDDVESSIDDMFLYRHVFELYNTVKQNRNEQYGGNVNPNIAWPITLCGSDRYYNDDDRFMNGLSYQFLDVDGNGQNELCVISHQYGVVSVYGINDDLSVATLLNTTDNESVKLTKNFRMFTCYMHHGMNFLMEMSWEDGKLQPLAAWNMISGDYIVEIEDYEYTYEHYTYADGVQSEVIPITKEEVDIMFDVMFDDDMAYVFNGTPLLQ